MVVRAGGDLQTYLWSDFPIPTSILLWAHLLVMVAVCLVDVMCDAVNGTPFVHTSMWRHAWGLSNDLIIMTHKVPED